MRKIALVIYVPFIMAVLACQTFVVLSIVD